DTIPALKQELAGYRQQLADSYLIDREVTEKLIAEAYERIQQDVDISHILFKLPPDAGPADTLATYGRALAAKERILNGEDFGKVAKEVSDDESVASNAGRIGYVTALFPNGMYGLETAAYEGPIGKVAGPVRTDLGYHLILVHDRRPARGEVEAAHILIRKKEDRTEKELRARIDSIHQLSRQGIPFEELAKKYSEDRQTAARGGYVGFFGINRYEKPFEEAAFGLDEDGAISEPFETSVGWHIVKRISRRGIQPYEDEKRRLENRIVRDSRFELARKAMLENIKRENNFEEYPQTLDRFADSLEESFLSFRWRPSMNNAEEVLFKLQGEENYVVTLGDFQNFLKSSSRLRLSIPKDTDPREAVEQLYEKFVEEQLMRYEESKLEEKYPSFKALMREYEEGILLFEITKQEVWDEASKDTSGLRDFYERNKSRYRWEERAVVSNYLLDAEAVSILDSVLNFAADHGPKETLSRFNREGKVVLTVDEKTINKSQRDTYDDLPWEGGKVTRPKSVRNGTAFAFRKVEEILPQRIKELNEARGYVVADYQDYLQEQWIEELKEKYEIEINRKVLESMIKE
ncbi:MAG: peptidylprolyl isomerase, partial [Saprospiraceae bacterium]|nr:peptidylprolyl isomerase [Saprospiraceae bacterium]